MSLYIHFPWCLCKCPYCDFNSFAYKPTRDDENKYVNALIADLTNDCQNFLPEKRELQSVFIGGGTPTIFSSAAIEKIITTAAQLFYFADDIEITIEANPGTINKVKCSELRALGINRISIGVQSFQDEKLQALGRIHNSKEAQNAINAVVSSGFENFNLDLMFGLPEQNIADALFDLQTATSFTPTHISRYQLTVETGTKFAQCEKNLKLPNDEIIWQMQQQGNELLQAADYLQYETSAYSKKNYQCKHNLNYWKFGDYLGIGAGAHGKIALTRYAKTANPNDYLNAFTSQNKFIAEEQVIAKKDLPFEFMLNALRLYQPIESSLFEERTGVNFNVIVPILLQAQDLGLVIIRDNNFATTDKGKNFLNDLIEMFL